MILDELPHPIVLAPLAGGPSTPELAAAVSEAGGFGFVAAGYLSVDGLAERLEATAKLTGRPIGVNLFVPGQPTPPEHFGAYAASLAGEADRAGTALGEPRFDDDAWQAKLDLLTATPVPVVSFTFGCPSADEIAGLRVAGSEVWVTVTDVDEAARAVGVGADVIVAQGTEAGGHRSTFSDDAGTDAVDGLSLLALLQLLSPTVAVPVVGAGGITTGAGVAAVLGAGAAAAQVGTAFLRCPEAGTSPVHRRSVAGPAPTMMTRAFTGRLARGVRNRFMDDHGRDAPAAYPEVHFLTAPLRQAGRAAGDGDVVNLWAGQTHTLAPELPAAEVVRTLSDDARLAVAGVALRLGACP